MRADYERASRLYGAAVEEFQGLVCADAESGPTMPYESIVTKRAEELQHRAERIQHETGIPVRVLHALQLLRVRS